MKKQLTNKTVYQPNGNVKVAVTNKPVFDEEMGQLAGYDTTVIVTVKKPLQPHELKFAGDDDIAAFMGEVEYDDPQQSLLPN